MTFRIIGRIGDHRVEVDPPSETEPRERPRTADLGDLRSAIATRQKSKAKAKAAAEAEARAAGDAARALPQRRAIAYVDRDGREYVVKSGEWVERTPEYWAAQTRRGGYDQVLETGDLEGRPTVTDHPQFGVVIVRGCLVCGHRNVARPKVTPMRVGKWRGGLCPECHSAWDSRSILARRQLGLFVAQRLYDCGMLPPEYPTRSKVLFGEHRVEHYPANWRSFTWAHRVLTSQEPSKQEPGSQPFFYLAGKLTLPAEVTA